MLEKTFAIIKPDAVAAKNAGKIIDRIEAETKFCVETTIEVTDEWLHSFYYFNDEIPTEADFIKTIGDYLTFEFSMVMQGREYLFEEGNHAESE